VYAQRLFTRSPQEALGRPQYASLRGGVRLGSLAFLAALAFFTWTPVVFARQTNPAQEELSEFLRTLSALRAGEEGVASKLLQQAETLCVDFARCDSLAVARYYLRLTPGQRARGLEAEKTFLALHERVVQAGRGELPPERDWPSERAALYAEIGSLASQVEGREDVVPAAQSYALLARLELSELEQDLDLSDARSQQLLGLIAAHIDRSLLLFERAGQVTPRLEPLWLRGRLARARAEHGRAREVFEDCLRLARDVNRFEYQERALSGLVDLAKDAGNLREVDEHLATWARLTSPSTSWPLAREHAARLLADDRAELALAFLAGHAPTHPGHQAQWRGMLAVSFLRTGDLISARREVQALGTEPNEFSALARAALALAEGVPDQVRSLLDDSDQRVQWSAQGQVEAASLLGESWLDSGQPARALPWLESALDEARRKARLVQDRAGSIVGEWVGMHTLTLLARAHAELGDPLSAAQVIEDNQSHRLRPAGSRITIDELRTWAARFDRGLVTFAVGADFTVVVWIDSSGRASASTRALGRRSLEAAVRRLREAVIAGDLPRAQMLGQEIGAALLPAELRAHLGSGGIDARALFLLHGPLESLPLTLLGMDGFWLDDLLTPLILPGLPLGEAAAPFAPDTPWTLMGSPLGREDRAPLLPGAARELAQLGRMHPDANLLTGTAFVRSAFEAAMESGRPLHLATHLVPAPGCGEGRLAPVGLLLSGGDVFCPEEILSRAPRLPLVVLAACETAGGRSIDAEGAHGVARAFLEAGTRDLLVTLWPISDSAAQTFALAYHESLRSGSSPARAAQEARRHLRSLGHGPQDWAAFRAMGRD
jgi:CHAT domain-containing protein